MTFRGLTWDHPRGYQALVAAQGSLIAWERQPLEGFESHPIEDLAARFDLVVIDHPHIGEAVEAGCLRPLEDVFAPSFLAALRREAIGLAYESYVYGGRSWALPLDAATQVMAARSDLLDDRPLPRTWKEVEALASDVPVCLSLAGPHAILNFLSICVALGEPPASVDPDVLVGRDTGRAALALLGSLHGTATPVTRGLNPIGILERMARSDDVALCPLVYGYVNYARCEAGRPNALTFADAPAIVPGGRPGSTLGGTGIALSGRCKPTAELLDHLAWLMDPGTQESFIPAQAGQPGLRSAWLSKDVNRAWGNFYEGTARTLEAAWVRPRHRGYIAFQTDAAAILRAALEERAPDDHTLSLLQASYARSRSGGGEI